MAIYINFEVVRTVSTNIILVSIDHSTKDMMPQSMKHPLVYLIAVVTMLIGWFACMHAIIYIYLPNYAYALVFILTNTYMYI